MTGQAAAAVIGLVTVPIYLAWLGREGYGVIAFFTSLQALAIILDLGFGIAGNREISRHAAAGDFSSARNLIRTLELVSAVTALVVWTGVSLAADWIAIAWIRSQHISPIAIHGALVISAGNIALRFPIGLYSGILRGLERQVALNVIASSVSVARACATVLILVFVSQDIVVFCAIQLAFSVFEMGLVGVVVWRSVGDVAGTPARLDMQILRDIWRFAFSIAGASVFAGVLKQLDKVVISKLLTIDQLGFYATASTAGLAIAKVYQPIQAAVFPRFTKMIANGEKAVLERALREATHVVAFVGSAVASVIMYNARDILALWTRSPELADSAASTLAIMALAMMFNVMVSMPYTIALAAGMGWMPLYTNAVGAVLLAPMVYLFVLKLGMPGGALAWAVFNLGYYAVFPQVVFRKVELACGWRWVVGDTLPFIAGGVLIFGAAHMVGSKDASQPLRGVAMVAALLAYAGAACAYSPAIRRALLDVPYIGSVITRLRRRWF